jgi:putative hemolysin
MEDLLEEIVGQIYDEYDRPPTAPLAGAGGAAAPVISGETEIKDVNEAYGLTLDDSDYSTIGGLLFGALGRLPKVGDQVRLPGAVFEILEMDGRRVGKVRVAAAATS